MLNCIIATMRPKSGTKRPSTPASFISRSTTSGALRGRQDVEEDLVGLGILAQSGSDELQRARREARSVRMDRQVVPVGEPEQPDQVDGIALEGVLVERR